MRELICLTPPPPPPPPPLLAAPPPQAARVSKPSGDMATLVLVKGIYAKSQTVILFMKKLNHTFEKLYTTFDFLSKF
jgi:hypothetical protein